jgi:hypothetical protein
MPGLFIVKEKLQNSELAQVLLVLFTACMRELGTTKQQA